MAERYSLPIPFGWYAVAFSADLAPGAVKPIHYFGKDMVLFRTESGEARVLDAFCPHLGAHLGHGGKVRGESIACPFHGWEFNGGGQCTAVPYAKNMPPKVAGGKQAVYAYPTLERNRVIWAWYHPQRIEPTYEIEQLPEYSADGWSLGERCDWIINTTLQETAENPVDAAHFIYVHGSAGMPSGSTIFDGVTRSSKYEVPVPKITASGDIDPSGTATVYLHAVAQGPGFTYQRFSGAINAVLMGLPVPISANQMQLHFAFAEPQQLSDGERMLIAFAKEELKRQVEADMPIWEHKEYLVSPLLCDGDGPIHLYRKWFRQFYADFAQPGDAQPQDLRAAG